MLEQFRQQFEALAAAPLAAKKAPAGAADSMADDDLVLATRHRSKITELAEPAPVPPVAPLAEVRHRLDQALADYLALDMPDHRLLCRVNPGVGKTHALVKAAIAAHRAGARVAYVMPRHNFIIDLMNITASLGHDPAIWYAWRGRHGDEAERPGNCHHARSISTWLARGHDGIKFCGGVCGWDYIQNGCEYHAQVGQAEAPIGIYNGIMRYPIVALQHAHIVTGHAMLGDFDLVIGDESPIPVYPHLWQIPADQITPSNIDESDSAWPLLAAMAAASVTIADNTRLAGPDLVALLGGPDRIIDAVRQSEAEYAECSIHTASSIDSVPYRHVPSLLRTLAAEARLVALGQQYNERVIITRGQLTLLLKNYTSSQLPAKVIWADATGDSALYGRVTGWRMHTFTASVALAGPVRQITDSTFAKSTMLAGKKPTAKAHKAIRAIRAIIEREGYRAPLVVSYSELAPAFDGWCQFTYFHGNRGSNSYQHSDAVFVLGTPMPAIEQLEIMARMLYAERSAPFDARWCARPVAYTGTRSAYLAGGLWADDDLALLLDQVRESEIVQSAHRVRPVLAPKPIWLFTALPVAELAPTELLTMAEAIGAPGGIDAGTFFDALDIASTEIDLKGYCTSEDLILMLECSRATAYRYLEALAVYDPARYAPLKIKAIGQRGAPKRAVGRQNEGDQQ